MTKDNIVSHFLNDLRAGEPIAVALSGGPDSLALSYMVSKVLPAGHDLHLLSVDHGLRSESGGELEILSAQVSEWGVHHILSWDHDGVESRLQEEARNARYDLMLEHCRAHGISKLFLGHHRDDQAETFLFRLSKGSGLDGLSGMAARQMRGRVELLRPLLTTSKADLIAFCDEHDLSYLSDPLRDKQSASSHPRSSP